MKKILIKKILSLSLASLLSIQVICIAAEPSVVIATDYNPDDVVVTLNVTSGVGLSDGLDATMSPNIGAVYSKSVGSSSWVVTTNNAAGYTLLVHASGTPALKKTATPTPDEFTDYTNVGSIPDTWGGVTSNAKEFGFSARGADVLSAYGGNTATTCGNTSTGIVDANSKYRGFNDVNDFQIATSSTVTTPTGTTTYICFAAEQGSGTFAASGAYTATITGTVAAL
jgi:hypothetical protein